MKPRAERRGRSRPPSQGTASSPPLPALPAPPADLALPVPADLALPVPADAGGRRRFLQLLAGAAAAPWARAALPALGLAGAATALAQPASDDAPPPEVEAWLAIVRQRYGAHLTSEQLQAVAENLSWTARSGKTLRGVALTNADEPDIVFRAEPPETP